MESSITEANSTTRQKSCNNCVKSKRGCDKHYPVCSRCQERNVTCIYAKPPSTEMLPGFLNFEVMEIDPSLANITNTPIGDLSKHLSTTTTSSGVLTSTLSPDPLDSLLGFMESGTSPSQDTWLIQPHGREIDVNDEPVLNAANYTSMDDICSHYEPWQVYDPNSKVHFVVESYKSLHRQFANDGQTPFLHRYLYKDNMPGLVLSCFTTSLMYASQTTKNKTIVYRALQRAINELKEQHHANTPQEKLARAQVLFLYQTIRLFDGDLTLRSCAESDMSLLQNWLDELSRVRMNLGALAQMDETELRLATPQSWEGWIFAESVRRTIILGNSFIALWKLMHGGSVGAWAYVHRWTLSRPLWEAPSSFDFFCAWKEAPQYIISNYEFDLFLKTGSGHDVDSTLEISVHQEHPKTTRKTQENDTDFDILDEFTRILLVTYMGLDETKQWFMDTGTAF